MLDKCVRARVAHRAAPWIFAVSVAVMPFTASAQSPLPGGAQSLTSSEASPAKLATARAPKQVDLSAVPQITAKELAAAAARPQPPRPRTSHTEQQYMALKAAAAQRRFDIPNLTPMSGLPANPPAGSNPASAGTEAILTPPTTAFFTGNAETPCGNKTPADMGLAVGDTNVGVLQVNNVCISVFSKSGVLQAGYPKSLTSFIGVPSTAFVFDPRALYDWANHRYIISFAEFDTVFCAAPCGVFWVAVSQGDSPAGGYNITGFFANSLVSATDSIPDFLRLGQDRQAIYVATNLFKNSTGAYLGEEWTLLPKAAMYAGSSFNYYVIDNPLGAFLDSSQPANVFSNTDNPRAEFFVTSLNTQKGFYLGCLTTFTGCNGLIVWAISNPLVVSGSPGPEISAVFVPTSFNYFFPPGATQPGTAATIDTNDVRISGEVSYGAGSLYAALTTADGTGAASSILYKIQPVLNVNGNGHCTGAFLNLCPDITKAVITSENFLFYGFGISAFYPTQQPDPEGNVTTVFNFSGSSCCDGSTGYISSRVTQGGGAATNNFADSGFTLVSGQSAYAQACSVSPITGQSECRWGDYTAVAPAGIGGSAPSPVMWFAGMFTDALGNWATEIGKNGFTSPSQP